MKHTTHTRPLSILSFREYRTPHPSNQLAIEDCVSGAIRTIRHAEDAAFSVDERSALGVRLAEIRQQLEGVLADLPLRGDCSPRVTRVGKGRPAKGREIRP